MMQVAAATHLLDYLSSVGNNITTVFEYRQIQVALQLFAQNARAVVDPSKEGFWLHDSEGKVCLAAQPWGTSDPFWNMSVPEAADYWVDSVVGELAKETVLAGQAVFFDEVDQGECGYRGGSCDFAAFNASELQAAKFAVYKRQTAAMNGAGIIPIFSLDNRLLASGNGTSAQAPCALPEDAMAAALAGMAWVRFYENWPQSFWVPGGPDLAAAMVSNAILEAEAGIPNALHSSASCSGGGNIRNITRPGPLGGPVEYAMSSYLIVAGPGTVLSLSSGWMDADFCWFSEFDVDFGTPSGPAVRTGTYTWTRAFSRATVQLDVQSSKGSVMLLE